MINYYNNYYYYKKNNLPLVPLTLVALVTLYDTLSSIYCIIALFYNWWNTYRSNFITSDYIIGAMFVTDYTHLLQTFQQIAHIPYTFALPLRYSVISCIFTMPQWINLAHVYNETTVAAYTPVSLSRIGGVHYPQLPMQGNVAFCMFAMNSMYPLPFFFINVNIIIIHVDPHTKCDVACSQL